MTADDVKRFVVLRDDDGGAWALPLEVWNEANTKAYEMGLVHDPVYDPDEGDEPIYTLTVEEIEWRRPSKPNKKEG